jgi:ABC-type dipeptide/oligopeptide/nickel transport system ATPase subunit
MKQKRHKEEDLKRINKQAILFNQRELNAIKHYCQRFKVQNKSKFMREAIITEVLRKFEANYPTLFEDSQLKLF